MTRSTAIALCLGVVAGFLGSCLMGRHAAQKNAYKNFLRLHPFLEQETSYFPTSSQLAATTRLQCPPGAGKILVILGGNSVFNGSGQKTPELWSRVLQNDLGAGYHVINFSAPGAGPADTGAIVFQMLARDYPRSLLVTNTEPGRYAPPESSAYSYLFWDAYYKGTLPEDPARAARLARETAADGWLDYKLDRGMNSRFYFHDLWGGVAYRHFSTIWTSWLKGRSFLARSRLPDWYDNRKGHESSEAFFESLLPGHLDNLRRSKSVDPQRFRKEADGHWVQTAESIQNEAEQISALLPDALKPRTIVVFTPFNPWFLAHLDPDERMRVDASFRTGTKLAQEGGYHALSTADKPFEALEFGDTVHLSPAGGQRLAHLVAAAVQDVAREQHFLPAP